MKALFQDVHHALRQLRHRPGFTLSAVVTLALGIAANVTIFSALNGLILRPLPVPHAEQITVLASFQPGAPVGLYALSYPELLDLRKQADTFSAIFAYDVALGGMSADNKADHFVGSFISGNYFSALNVRPELGRFFAPGEGEQPGSEVHIVLGYSYWKKRFAGNSDVIGRHVRVDGKPATIIGVAPKEFQGTSFGVNMDAYLPLSMAAADDPSMWTSRDDRRWMVMGRLKPGTSLSQAQSSMSLIMARLASQYPATDKGIQLRVIPERLSRPVPLPNNIVLVIAGLFLSLAVVVLLLACINVANILLVRATTRQTEMAIRTAMGASRARLFGLILIESTLLALFGAAAGMILGRWATRGIMDLRLASFLPVSLDLGVDWRVLSYALASTACAGLLVGLWPALHIARSNLNQALRGGGRPGATGSPGHRLRSLLVGAQITASLMLLIVAGLFARSLRSVRGLDLGFQPDHLLNVILDPHEIGYDQGRTASFYQNLEDRVRALPGVLSASTAFSVPMGSYSSGDAVTIEGHPTPAGQPPPVIMENFVDPAYFQTMKIPLLRGRSFTDFDGQPAPHVAIVNQTMADRFWPNEDPTGRRFQTESTWWQVVGVAQNGRYGFMAESARPFFYLPLKQHFVSMRVLEIRTSIAPEALIAPVQQVIKELEPDLPIFSVRTMSESLAGANGFMIFRMGARIASWIGLMGLMLAVIGVYGVVAFAASQRTREIGIRVALGATRAQVLRLVLGQGMWVIVGGAALGLLVTLAISRGIANLLVGISATDPLTFLSATLLLLTVALCACYIPARRAMKVDPMAALRYE